MCVCVCVCVCGCGVGMMLLVYLADGHGGVTDRQLEQRQTGAQCQPNDAACVCVHVFVHVKVCVSMCGWVVLALG